MTTLISKIKIKDSIDIFQNYILNKNENKEEKEMYLFMKAVIYSRPGSWVWRRG